MIAIIAVLILASILHLAVWEGVVLGVAFLIGYFADISVNYSLIGGIVLALWALTLLTQILFLVGGHQMEKKAEEEFNERSR